MAIRAELHTKTGTVAFMNGLVFGIDGQALARPRRFDTPQ